MARLKFAPVFGTFASQRRNQASDIRPSGATALPIITLRAVDTILQWRPSSCTVSHDHRRNAATRDRVLCCRRRFKALNAGLLHHRQPVQTAASAHPAALHRLLLLPRRRFSPLTDGRGVITHQQVVCVTRTPVRRSVITGENCGDRHPAVCMPARDGFLLPDMGLRPDQTGWWANQCQPPALQRLIPGPPAGTEASALLLANSRGC